MLLVASDSPYLEPLNTARPLPDHFGVALLFTPEATDRSLASLTIRLGAPQPAACVGEASLDALHAIPAAAALPLLVAMAKGVPQRDIAIDYLPAMGLRVDVAPHRALANA